MIKISSLFQHIYLYVNAFSFLYISIIAFYNLFMMLIYGIFSNKSQLVSGLQEIR